MMILFLKSFAGLNKLLKDLIVLSNSLTKLPMVIGSEEGSNTHIVLFVAYYNFLRPHKHFCGNVLNHVPELTNCPNMPLIEGQ